ncbi:3-hydroxyacyl-ACP dehydratase [Panacibacter ginsenosidivorans]|uniref:3-hydroxyacyl-ACP dehydratase n=1 Tax=Panacibacter ginsenosidivorans TaxID=1813871 RepID=A0A5B8VEJ4_9BACT|nr:3-hydroxyacyl-ACP dehydratase [Panacibacter ginsenosidivorans]QEC69453.1 3-hydroxyacyl-ACP dehydratase [Panacibacter ginsenosidivorans]
MLLENNFYTIESFANEEGIAKATIAINASHKIFEGHFPGAPVVPGVCMMQIIKEFLEKALAGETRLSKADHLKFLAIINPAENNIANIEVKYKINESDIDVTAAITNSTATNFKMKAQFILL